MAEEQRDVATQRVSLRRLDHRLIPLGSTTRTECCVWELDEKEGEENGSRGGEDLLSMRRIAVVNERVENLKTNREQSSSSGFQ